MSAPSLPAIRWSGQTHVGKVRKNNEDAFLVLRLENENFAYLGKEDEGHLAQGDFLFAVSDGMGGAHAGEFASRIAVEKITRLLPKGYRSMAAGLSAGFADLFEELYLEINQALNYLGSQYEECRGMGATLTLAWVVPDWLYFAHIGDSRLYYLSHAAEGEAKLRQLSEDHSHVGWLRRTGKISEREARSHPMKNSLNRALGAGHQFVSPQVGAVAYEPGDAFLLCSDGIVDGLWDRQIRQLLCEPDLSEAALAEAPRLIQAALERSGRDNLTALYFAFPSTSSTASNQAP
jgi:protein phosphatase